jgi:hypothetical protein
LAQRSGPAQKPTSAARPAQAREQNEKIAVHTRWLPNDLRVVTITGPWQTEMVSIRLLVAGGIATAREPEKYAIHFLEHLVFSERQQGRDPYTTEGEGGGRAFAYIGLDYQLHEFDVAVPEAQTILDEIVAEWDRTSFDETQFEIERLRVQHELGAGEEGSCLTDLANDLRPRSTLVYSDTAERAFVDTVSARTLRRIFNERYVSGRMTLVVAGNARVLSALNAKMEEFARIPSGAGDNAPDWGDLSWLSGDVRTTAWEYWDQSLGFRFPNPEELTARTRYLICFAIAAWSKETLEEDECDAGDLTPEVCRTPKEELWVYPVKKDACSMDSEPTAYEIVEESLTALTLPAALEWWRTFIEKDTKENERIDDRPDGVADMLVFALIGSSQNVSAPSWAESAGPVDPLVVLHGAQQLRDRAVVFRVCKDERRSRIEDSYATQVESGASDASSRDLLADFVSLEGGDQPAWSMVTFLSVVITASAGIGLGLARVARKARSRWPNIRLPFASPRKRGPTEDSGSHGLGTWILGGVLLSFMTPGTGRAATNPVNVTRFANGLAVYTRAGDYPENYVSVRLVVDPPHALPGSREYREFQTLAHSVFRSDRPGHDLFEYLDEWGCYAGASVEFREAVFEFDVSPDLMDTLFVRIARQWETGLSWDQVSLGVDEMKEALPDMFNPVIERLGHKASEGALYDLPPRDSDIPNLFDTRMCARNLSLVLVGSKANVVRALAAARVLDQIPEGQRASISPLDVPPGYRLTVPPITVFPASKAVYATYGALLRGHVTWDTECPWSMTLVVNGGRGLDPAETDFYYGALSSRLRDEVSLRYGSVYGVGGSLYLGPSEHVMTFWPSVDEEIVRYDDLAEEIKDVTADLADPASMSWWRSYVEGRMNTEAFYGVGAPDASTAADGLVRLVTLARLQGRVDVGGPYLPSAEGAQLGFAQMLDDAQWFVMAPPAEPAGSVVYASLASAFGYIYGDLFGPDDRTRALAVLCQCLLVLLVLRRVERRMGRRLPYPPVIPAHS